MFSKIIVGHTKQNRTRYFQVMKEICSKYQDNILTETLTLMQTICDLYLLFSFVKKKTKKNPQLYVKGIKCCVFKN